MSNKPLDEILRGFEFDLSHLRSMLTQIKSVSEDVALNKEIVKGLKQLGEFADTLEDIRTKF